MRYHLDTIPVWDAVRADSECPLCLLRRKTELEETDRFLGASVMEPDIRVSVNKAGFCAKHHTMLYASANRLGHALMLQTCLQHQNEYLDTVLKPLAKKAEAYAGTSAIGRLSGRKDLREELLRAAAQVRASAEGCILCSAIASHMERYTHTFFHLYQTDQEFRKKLAESKGFCIPDSAWLLEHAAEELNGKEAAQFASMISDLMHRNLTRTQEDIDWFIKKYDYRYDHEPWKNSRDAVERTANKLRGWCVGREPVQEDKP